MNHSKSRSSLSKTILNLIEIGVVFAAIFLIAGLFARKHFLLDLLSHGRVHAWLAFCVGGPLLLLAGRSRIGIIGCVLGVLVTVSLVPHFVDRSRHVIPQHDGDSLSIMTTNVLTRNQNKSGVIADILNQDPTIVTLLEVSDEWYAALSDGLNERYPYHFGVPRRDNFGIAMFSRIPFESKRVADFGGNDVPTLDATFKNSGQTFRVIATHPVPPMNTSNWEFRNQQLIDLAETISSRSEPTLLVGDLNCTQWSPFFTDLIAAAELHDSARGFVPWPTWYPISVLPGLPIDHILFTNPIQIASRTIGAKLGSDHRSVMVEFRISESLAQ